MAKQDQREAVYVGMLEVEGTKMRVFGLAEGVRLEVTTRVKVGFLKKWVTRTIDLPDAAAMQAVKLLEEGMRCHPTVRPESTPDADSGIYLKDPTSPPLPRPKPLPRPRGSTVAAATAFGRIYLDGPSPTTVREPKP